MMKYQLKFNTGDKLMVLKQTDIMYDILTFVENHVVLEDISKLSVWMDGKVLE